MRRGRLKYDLLIGGQWLYKYILKLPHYSCQENQLYFLGKRFCKLSEEAASFYRSLLYRQNEVTDYSERLVDELLQTQAIMVCNLPKKPASDAPLILVVSPHLDDAIFSIGGLLARLASRYRIHIFTLFSTDPYCIFKELKNDFNRLQELRLEEEAAATSFIHSSTFQLKWKEALLREYKDIYESIKQNEPMDQFISDIINNIPENPFVILCPLGISHVDHRLTRILMDKVIERKQIKTPIIYYEDLPYACSEFTEPERLRSCSVKLNNDEISRKKKMVKSYVTQLAPGLTLKILKHRDGQEFLWYQEGLDNPLIHDILGATQ